MQGLLFLLFLPLGFAFFLSCLTYCYSYSGLWEQCTSMMKEKIDDQKDFQKKRKLLWRVHENLTFCLESLGLWGATQVSANFSDSVTVTCWISLLLFLWIIPFFSSWSCGSIQVFEAHIRIHFCSSNTWSYLLFAFFLHVNWHLFLYSCERLFASFQVMAVLNFPK